MFLFFLSFNYLKIIEIKLKIKVLNQVWLRQVLKSKILIIIYINYSI